MHNREDFRSWAFHRAVAHKVRDNPALLAIAYENLDRWETFPGSVHSRPLFTKWRTLLDGPIETLLERMVEDSDTMQQLRSASPFAGILSDRERLEIIEQTRNNTAPWPWVCEK